ncbi:hypothetical protein HHI36_009229 [Cryptolaemus montrouzieri]|uniref:Uncharacterized protein n=1 Tax=Cryptolaemus montrouzieri TaxID=559131 RepID=A0ABD2MVJ3_9CUCU
MRSSRILELAKLERSRERTSSPEDDSEKKPGWNPNEEPFKTSFISKFSAGIKKNELVSHKRDSGDILPSLEYFEYESTGLNSLDTENIRSMLILQPRDMNFNETVTLENATSEGSVENPGSSTSEATARIDKPENNRKIQGTKRMDLLRPCSQNKEEIARKASHKG